MLAAPPFGQASVLTITVDTSVLLGWYNARAGVTDTSASGGSGSTASTSAHPTAPWASGSTYKPPAVLAKAALNGAKIVDPAAAKLDVNGANAAVNADYKNLFALYQGVATLQQLAQQASTTTNQSVLADLKKTFASGLSQVHAFVSSAPFKEFSVAEGTVSATSQSAVSTPKETDTYQTKPLFTGGLNDPVPAFAGNVAFHLTVTKASGAQVNLDLSLDDMGATPRSMPNVVSYLNGQMAAAGVFTRFANVRVPAVAQTIGTGPNATTLPAGADSFALNIKGVASETLNFSAVADTPTLYVAQTSGTTTSTTKLTNTGVQTVAPNATQQLLTLNADPNLASGTSPVIGSRPLGAQITAARATAAGPDGSLFVLADQTGDITGGTQIQGQKDVVLTKYDSAGRVVFTRTLGAADSASGYSLAVSADGESVAVASAVTGALQAPGSVDSKGASDTVVSVFDATTGSEAWTTRAGAVGGADQPTAVAFGADGSVYVSGVTSAKFTGQTLSGAQDTFLETFSPAGAVSSAIQFGGTGVDASAGMAISGTSLVVASQESGHAILRSFDISSGTPILANTRDLGDLQGGNIAGVAVAADGSVVVAGSTRNGSLSAGTVASTYDGGRDGFVARLSADLTAGAADQISYFSAPGDLTASAITTANGQVYVAGQFAGPPDIASHGQASHEGYVAAIDQTTGAVTWSHTLIGVDGQGLPSSIAVANQSSSLAALGLPSGTIDFTPPTALRDISSARPGDKFYMATGRGSPVAVTIAAGETLKSLAVKINRASYFGATATVVTGTDGVSHLQIAPTTASQPITLSNGPAGQDALAALGITPGQISKAAASTKTISPTSSIKVAPYGLGITSTLNLNTAADIQHALNQFSATLSLLKKIYTNMTTPPAPAASSATSGKVPAYLTAQIADYQNALNRLTGGSTTQSALLG